MSCYNLVSSSTYRALFLYYRWGREKESQAVSQFQKSLVKRDLHPGFTVEECGLFISSSHPYIAASPNRLFSCPCHGPGVIECKAPYASRSVSVFEAAKQNNFCLSIDSVSGELYLKRESEYFYQVQAQMFATQRSFCFFLVWTEIDMSVSFIEYDPSFFENVIHKCTAAFKFVILPELLSDHFSQTRHRTSLVAGDRLICFCREVKKDSLIVRCATGKDNCPVYEFHKDCVLKKNSQKRITNRWKCDSCKDGCKKRKNDSNKVLKEVNGQVAKRNTSV